MEGVSRDGIVRVKDVCIGVCLCFVIIIVFVIVILQQQRDFLMLVSCVAQWREQTTTLRTKGV